MNVHHQPDRLHEADHAPNAPDIHRAAAWSAMVGSVLYVAVFTAKGWLQPDYNSVSMFISQLALGQWGWVQNANFIFFGSSVLLFALGAAIEFGSTRTARSGVTMLALIGVSMVGSGFFVIDPIVDPASAVVKAVAFAPRDMSFQSKFHYALGTMTFLLAPASCLCFLISNPFSVDPARRTFWWWTLALGLLMFASMILLKIAVLPPVSNPLFPWRGVLQRVMVIPFLIWLFIFGLMMLRRGLAQRPVSSSLRGKPVD